VGSTTASAPHAAAPAGEGQVAGDDGAHAPGFEHADHRQADRSAADHDRDLSRADLAVTDGVQPNGHRLGERGDVGAEPVRDGEGPGFLDEDLFGVGAGCGGQEPGGVEGGAAAQQREGHDGRAGRQRAPRLLAVLEDLAAELMADLPHVNRTKLPPYTATCCSVQSSRVSCGVL